MLNDPANQAKLMVKMATLTAVYNNVPFSWLEEYQKRIDREKEFLRQIYPKAEKIPTPHRNFYYGLATI